MCVFVLFLSLSFSLLTSLKRKKLFDIESESILSIRFDIFDSIFISSFLLSRDEVKHDEEDTGKDMSSSSSRELMAKNTKDDCFKKDFVSSSARFSRKRATRAVASYRERSSSS